MSDPIRPGANGITDVEDGDSAGVMDHMQTPTEISYPLLDNQRSNSPQHDSLFF